MEKWKKHGLYSSMSQFLLFLQILILSHRGSIPGLFKSLQEIIKLSPDNGWDEYTFFRNPGVAERSFISRIRQKDHSQLPLPSPCGRVLCISIPFIFHVEVKKRLLTDFLLVINRFTTDTATIAGSLLYAFLLDTYLHDDTYAGENVLQRSLYSCDEIIRGINEAPHRIFEAGTNPESLLHSIKVYRELMLELTKVSDCDKAERLICARINPFLKNRVSRATVNHPLLILPYAIYLFNSHSDIPDRLLYRMILEGGSTAILASLAGGLAGAVLGSRALPEPLINGLVNKHRINHIVQSVAGSKINDTLINEFITTELSLTMKEIEERKSRLKHTKKKEKTDTRPKRREDALSRHIVESWTKMDKAKWKKERKKSDDQSNK